MAKINIPANPHDLPEYLFFRELYLSILLDYDFGCDSFAVGESVNLDEHTGGICIDADTLKVVIYCRYDVAAGCDV